MTPPRSRAQRGRSHRNDEEKRAWPSRSGLLALVTLALVVSLAPPELAEAQARPSLILIGFIDEAKAEPSKKWEAFDTSNLNFFDLDNDGLLELVTQNDNNRVYVIDPRNGTILAELSTTHPGGDRWGARDINGVAIGDVDQDGRADLVVANSASYLTLFSFDPQKSTPTKFAFEKRWERFVDIEKFEPDFYKRNEWAKDLERYPGLDGNPFIAAVDGDGTQTIFVQTDGKPGHFAFKADGSLRWKRDYLDGNAGPVVTNVDGDGAKDAVFATDSGLIFVADAATGVEKWNFSALAHGATPGSIAIMPLVVDLRNDGNKEIVFGARQAVEDESDPDWIAKQHARYFALSGTGEMLWNVSFAPWGNPHAYMHPAATDVDGDGVLDLLFVDWNTIGRNPGNWELTGRPANLIAVSGATGEAIWRRGIDATWSNKDIVVADVNGDGKQDILVEEQDATGLDGLSLYGSNSMRKDFAAVPSGWLLSRGPVAADLYGDGHVYVAVPVYRNGTGCLNRGLDVGCREGAIAIFRGEGALTSADWTNNVLFNGDLSDSLDPHGLLPASLSTRPAAPQKTVPAPTEPLRLDSEATEGRGETEGFTVPIPPTWVILALLVAPFARRKNSTAR